MRPALRYRLVAFDFDGTLADTFPWFSRVIDDVADRYRFRRVAPDETEALRGMSARAIVAHLGIPAWKLPSVTRHMHSLAARDAESVRLFPGIVPMLAKLEGAGIRLAIVSSNTEANIRRVLEPEDAGRIGHYACGASLFGKARRLRAVMRAAGVAAADTLYVGDEIRDHEAAAEASCDFGAVAWGYTRMEAVDALRPALTFADPAEIASTVTRSG